MNSVLLTAVVTVLCGSPILNHASAASEPVETPDPRNFANGWLIPDEDYCDQPRVVVTKDGTWVCLMTTGPAHEGSDGQHIVATFSQDKGKHWSPLVDVEPRDPERKSSYALALITPSDRIYAFYCYNGDKTRALPNGQPIRNDMQGWFCYRYSDDRGRSWSERYRLPMRLTSADRNNDWQGKLQMFWAIGTPAVYGHTVIFGFTKLGKYLLQEGEGWFFRSDNLLTEPDARNGQWQMLPEGDFGVRTPEFGSVQEEHDVVHLDGDELFTVYRTTMGHAACAYSRDGGRHWEKPEPLRYSHGGRIMKQPRACAKIWKTKTGQYLLWYHNNGTTTYNNGPNAGSRNIAWLSGGVVRDGRLHWSQPEVVAYVDGGLEGCSYPDLVEDGGQFYICATQKTEARVLEVPAKLFAGLWTQDSNRTVATNGLALNLAGDACAAGSSAVAPKFPALCPITRERTPALNGRGGLSVEMVVRFTDLSPGQVLVDARDTRGKGLALTTTDRGTVRLEISDGWRGAFWDCDANLLKPNTDHHVVAIVDGGPKAIGFVIDGKLCDGGSERAFGFGRFDPALKEVNGARDLNLAPNLRGKLKLLRIYHRALRTSEAIGNYHSAHESFFVPKF